ncbi:SMI1/KNR4 family protein [Bacillus sp. EB01]|uniref:SMI1/KNR4 family protein n=1 Tax=Bacillus sp. EB01 TaxID=1347086 RepID=UPI0005C6BC39|nr:SMI1/KNR4 family protein [Bacillus sp. EB01]
MDNSFKGIYGSYEIPEEIYKLYELERELNDIDLSLNIIGLQPCLDDYFDQISPPDLIPFATTGGDGIYFGFLTDFGQVPSIKEASIVCVSPTNDPPIRYIANNIKDFLNLVSSVPHAEMLESFWANPDESQIQQVITEFVKDTPSAWKEKRRKVTERFKEKYATQNIEIGSYLQWVQEKRAHFIFTTTLDGLGIVGGKEQTNSCTNYQFDFNKPLDDHELNRMKDYLNESNSIVKLAFIRDVIYVVRTDFEENMFNLIIDLMESMNLNDEVHRFSRGII